MNRRRACPRTIQFIWDAVQEIRVQKQQANLARISGYLKRVHKDVFESAEEELHRAAHDGLIVMQKVTGCKGSKAGKTQERFVLPREPVENDGHDWYCFACHKPGEVVCCTSCHLVYHKSCLGSGEASLKKIFICGFCRGQAQNFTGTTLTEDEEQSVMHLIHLLQNDVTLILSVMERCNPQFIDPETLNGLLQLTFKQLRSDLKVLRCVIAKKLISLRFEEDSQNWRWKRLIYHSMDFSTMEGKASSGSYKHLEEFKKDALTILHNMVIFFGEDSALAKAAKDYVSDCMHEADEIALCPDCYRMSHTKPVDHWFTIPCNPPHKLVLAKQAGFSFWPAKVIHEEGDCVDVRFFGVRHERAKIPKSNVKPIPVNTRSLQKSPALTKAFQELSLHKSYMRSAPATAPSSVIRASFTKTNGKRKNCTIRKRPRSRSVSPEVKSENSFTRSKKRLKRMPCARDVSSVNNDSELHLRRSERLKRKQCAGAVVPVYNYSELNLRRSERISIRQAIFNSTLSKEEEDKKEKQGKRELRLLLKDIVKNPVYRQAPSSAGRIRELKRKQCARAVSPVNNDSVLYRLRSKRVRINPELPNATLSKEDNEEDDEVEVDEEEGKAIKPLVSSQNKRMPRTGAVSPVNNYSNMRPRRSNRFQVEIKQELSTENEEGKEELKKGKQLKPLVKEMLKNPIYRPEPSGVRGLRKIRRKQEVPNFTLSNREEVEEGKKPSVKNEEKPGDENYIETEATLRTTMVEHGEITETIYQSRLMKCLRQQSSCPVKCGTNMVHFMDLLSPSYSVLGLVWLKICLLQIITYSSDYWKTFCETYRENFYKHICPERTHDASFVSKRQVY